MLNPQELHSTLVSGKRVSSLGAGEAEGKGKESEILLQNARVAAAKSSQVVSMPEMF